MTDNETMTLAEFVDSMYEEDDEGPVDSRSVLVGVVALLRSLMQREITTDEGILAGCNAWVEAYGKPTEEKIRTMVAAFGEMAHKPIPIAYIEAVMKAD